MRSNSAIRELKSRNSKSELLAWPEPVELRDGFEPVCFDLIVRSAYSEPPELVERAVALGARYARAAVELEAPGSRHRPKAVVEGGARQPSDVAAQGEPVRSAEARDESARSALCEKVLGCGAARGCGAVSGSREVARKVRLSAWKSWALCAARILHWRLNVQYRSGNTENRLGIVADILDRFSFQPHLWWQILIFAPVKIKITPCGCLRSERRPPTFLRDATWKSSIGAYFCGQR